MKTFCYYSPLLAIFSQELAELAGKMFFFLNT